MGMDVSGVNNQAARYYGVSSHTYQAAGKTDEKSRDTGATVEISGDGQKAYNDSRKVSEDKVTTKDPYATAKKSQTDRAAVVKQLKADQEQRTQSMLNMVRSVLGQQSAFASATEDGIWKLLADGNFTVDAQTKADAQAAIAEDGYYGIRQTSERLFEFAQALAGDDVDKMKQMQEAVHKGFKMATGTWGKDLPQICQDTVSAVDQMFEDYYSSKNTTVTE